MAATTRCADTCDQESVSRGLEPMCFANFVAKFEYLVISELDDLVAFGAMEMVVRRIAVVVFVRAPIRKPKFSK